MPMGWTSENVAADYNISREEMDEFAALSYQRAERAQKAGLFEAETVPFVVPVIDPKTGERSTQVVTKDDGIRYGTSKESLLKIRPAFPQWGPSHTTGGNASQITDGAAAVLLMKRSKAELLGLNILGKHVTTAVTGVSPRVMGVGPAYAIPMALNTAGITKDDVDLFEVSTCVAASSLSRIINPFVPDQRSFCVSIRVLLKGAGTRQGEGKCKWRRDSVRSPSR